VIRLVALALLLVASAPRADGALMAGVTVNGQKQAPVVLDRERMLVPLADFRAWQLTPPDDAIEGDHVALGRIPWLAATFDEREVILAVTVEPGRLPARGVDMRPKFADARQVAGPSAFLNYSALAATDAKPFLTFESGARYGQVLLYGSGVVDRGDWRRLQVAAIHDEREAGRRTTVGDFFTASTALQSPVAMTGLHVASERTLNPYRVFYPVLDLSTAAALPSEVEVRVDGQLVRRERVAPGPVNIEGLTAPFGSRNVEVTVRDPFGREQTVSQAYYFTDEVLAVGRHEYSYGLGALREGYGGPDDRLGDAAAIISHRYGLNDRLTLGYAAQSGPVASAGLSAALASRAGVFSLAAATTEAGPAAAAAWRYSVGRYSAGVTGRHTDFADFASASASMSFGQGTASIGYADSSSARPLHSLAYRYDIGRAALVATATEQAGVWTAALHLRLFYGDYSASASATRDGQTLEAMKQIPRGEGVGYGALVAHNDAGTHGEAWTQVNARHAVLRARVNGEQSIAIAGGLGYVDGHTFTSRPLEDSFGVVKLADLEGVPVHVNGGRYVTDANGEAVVPLASYGYNAVTFDRKAIPLDYTFTQTSDNISPAWRSGARIAFDVRKLRAVMGRLVGASGAAIEGKAIALEQRGVRVDAFTSKGGEWYAEVTEPGEWILTAPGCAALVRSPAEEPFAEVGTIVCK
jgi:outer membrane usher protein